MGVGVSSFFPEGLDGDVAKDGVHVFRDGQRDPGGGGQDGFVHGIASRLAACMHVRTRRLGFCTYVSVPRAC